MTDVLNVVKCIGLSKKCCFLCSDPDDGSAGVGNGSETTTIKSGGKKKSQGK